MGSFDPYSDDPRLGIQKIFLCKYSGYLAVAGTAGQVAGWAGEQGEEGLCRVQALALPPWDWGSAGTGTSPRAPSGGSRGGSARLPPAQVLVLELNDEAAEHAVEQAEADLLQEQEGYRWKGHERLCARPGPVRFEPGFQPFVLVQCQPPAVVTSLALHSEWRLVAFGTSHGFGLFDHQQRRQVFVK